MSQAQKVHAFGSDLLNRLNNLQPEITAKLAAAKLPPKDAGRQESYQWRQALNSCEMANDLLDQARELATPSGMSFSALCGTSEDKRSAMLTEAIWMDIWNDVCQNLTAAEQALADAIVCLNNVAKARKGDQLMTKPFRPF